jgi:hypothetical protein
MATTDAKAPEGDDSWWNEYYMLNEKLGRVLCERDGRARSIAITEPFPEEAVQLPPALREALKQKESSAEAEAVRLLILSDSGALRGFRSADGQWLVTSRCGDERAPAVANVWNLVNGMRTASIPTEWQVQDATFAQAFARLALASGFNRSGVVQFFDLNDGMPFAPPISGERKPIQVSFSPDALRVAVGFTDSMGNANRVGVFDVSSGSSIIEADFGTIIKADFGAVVAKFLPGGQRLGSNGFSPYDVPAPGGPAPDWLPELARLLARRELDSGGSIIRIRDTEARWKAIRQKLAEAPDSPSKQVVSWLLTAPLERSISPFSQQTYRSRVETEIGEWKSAFDEQLQESPENLESAAFSALGDARGLRAKAFGAVTLLAPLESQCERLREKMLAHFTARVAGLEKQPERDRSLTVSDLRRLQDLQPEKVEFSAQIQLLIDRITTVKNPTATKADE